MIANRDTRIMSDDYSIWLIPDTESSVYRSLDELITSKAEEYPDAPDFRPHVTVLGGLDMERDSLLERTQELAASQDPFEIDFIDISCSTTNHQCVFLLADPSIELLSLNQRAIQLCEQDNSMYVPHLSLIYSDMGLDDRVEATRSIGAESLPSSVEIETIEVVDTSGPEPNWETVAEYEF